MIDPAFVDLLVCPETRQPLELRSGVGVGGRALGAALVRADDAVLYPVYDGVPALLPEAAVPAGASGRERRAPLVETGFGGERLARLAELERSHFWFGGRRDLVARLVTRYADPPPQLLLDVGCGTGAIVELLTAHGFRVVGLETDLEGLLATAPAHPGAWFLQADGARLPFRAGTFAGVTVLDVLEHVDDAAVLAEIRRVTKPGGWLLASVPAMPWLWSHFDEVAGHRRRYTRRAFSRLLEGSGFEIARLSYFQFFLFPLVAATRLLGRKDKSLREREQRPSRPLNAALSAITRLEVALGDVIPWPWGSSLVAFCRKSGV